MIAIVVLLTASQVFADDYFDNIEWELKRDKRGIQVYTGNVDGSNQKAIFSTVQLKASVNSVVALLLDLPNCNKWAPICREAVLIEKLSVTEAIVYSLNDIPFPVRDRDTYSKVSWQVDSATGVVTMNSEAQAAHQFPLRKGVVRVEFAKARWRFVPIDHGDIIVENYVHVDPNGKLPAWFSNIFIIDTPYKALRGIRSVLATGEYDNIDVPFLNQQ